MDSSIHAISIIKPIWKTLLANSYNGDKKIKDLLLDITLGNAAHPDYEYQQDILKYKGRILIGSNVDLRRKLIFAMHDLVVEGHSGNLGNYQMLRNHFYWQGMKKYV
ncbi:hypothetical protein ACH5RR_015238 [Cinchona calisaya]|uniref:Integrase zinc-binding domain-containing protein n=1 Tax=Cinchona calisaya TaxID=153742 RepID=A0ABD2ZSM4_9GENT